MDTLKSLNIVMNNIDNWRQPSQGFLSRHVKARMATLFIATPLEAASVAQNAIIAPFQATGVLLKLSVKSISFFSRAAILDKIDQKLPTLTQFFKTLLRIVALSIGTLASGTIGFLFPSLNFKLQVALGLVKNERNELYKFTLLDIEVQKLANEIKKLQEDKAKVFAAKIEASKKLAENEAARLQLQQDRENVIQTTRLIEAQSSTSSDKAISELVKNLFSEAETANQEAAALLNSSTPSQILSTTPTPSLPKQPKASQNNRNAIVETPIKQPLSTSTPTNNTVSYFTRIFNATRNLFNQRQIAA